MGAVGKDDMESLGMNHPHVSDQNGYTNKFTFSRRRVLRRWLGREDEGQGITMKEDKDFQRGKKSPIAREIREVKSQC